MPKAIPTNSKEYEDSEGTHISNIQEIREKLGESPETRYNLFEDNRKILPKVLGLKPARWMGYIRWDITRMGTQSKKFQCTCLGVARCHRL